MTGWDWVWIILSAPWMCWRMAHLISALIWQSTARAYRLWLPRAVTVDDISQWTGQLAAILRAPRWWDFLPRWPVGMELVATEHGIEHLIVIPARLRKAVVATLAAALPGARLDEPPTTPTQRSSGWVKAGEIRLRGTRQLLAVDRGDDTSRHLLATLQPRRPGEVARVQWLIVGARAPRPPHDDQILRARSPHVTVPDQRQRIGVRWEHSDPVLSAVCRIGITTSDRPQARAALRRIQAALRGENTPGARITRRWLPPSVVVAARLTYRTIPLAVWPLTLTTRE